MAEQGKAVLGDHDTNTPPAGPRIPNIGKAVLTNDIIVLVDPKPMSDLITPRSARTPRTPRTSISASVTGPGTLFLTPSSKLHHPSPEPTIRSLRAVNVHLHRRVKHEEEVKRQLKADLARNMAEQHKLNERIKATQSKLRQSLEQQSALHGTVRELMVSKEEQAAKEQEHEREIQRLKRKIAEMKDKDVQLRSRLKTLDEGSASTRQHAKRVASTIAAIQDEGSRASAADSQVLELQQKLTEARRKAGHRGTPGSYANPMLQGLLQELTAATKMQYKAHAKIKHLEGQADALRQEVTAREYELSTVKMDLEHARSNADKLQNEYRSLEDMHQDEVTCLRKQQLELTVQCKEAEDKVNSLSSGMGDLQQRVRELSEAKEALHCQLDQATQQDSEHVQQLQQLQDELKQLAADREAARAAAKALQLELEDTENNMKLAQKAAKVGTPRGETAKEVLKRSFVKIKLLQGELSDAQQRAAVAAAALERTQGENQNLSQAHDQELRRLRSALSTAEQEVKQLQDAFTEELTGLRTSRAQAADELEALKSRLEASQQREDDQTARLLAARQDLDKLLQDRNTLSLENIELESHLHDVEADLMESKQTEEDLRDALREHMRAAMAKHEEADKKIAEAHEVICLLERGTADSAAQIEMQSRALTEAEQQTEAMRQELLAVEEAAAVAEQRYLDELAIERQKLAEAACEKQKVQELLAAKLHYELHLKQQLLAVSRIADEFRQRATQQQCEMQHAIACLQEVEQQKAAELAAISGHAAEERAALQAANELLEVQLEASLEDIRSLQELLDNTNTGMASAQEQLAATLANNTELQMQLMTNTGEVDLMQQQLVEYEERHNSLQAQVDAAVERNEALQTQQQALQAEVHTLQQSNAALQEELLAARMSGTPKGNTAKVVLPLALQKLKDAQTSLHELDGVKQALQEQLEAVSLEKDAYFVKATARITTLEDEHQADVQHFQQLLTAAESMVSQTKKELDEAALQISALQGAVGVLRKEKAELQTQLHIIVKERDETVQTIEGQLTKTSTANAELEIQVSQQQKQMQVLLQQTAAFEAKAAADQEDKLILHQQLNQLRTDVSTLTQQLATAQAQNEEVRAELLAARRQGTPQGQGAKQVLPMAFTRIRELQDKVEEVHGDKRATEARLEALQMELMSTQEELQVARGQLRSVAEEAGKLQETLLEVDIAGADLPQDSSGGIAGQLQAAQAAIGNLNEEREMLMTEVHSLQRSLHLSQRTGTPRGDGAKIVLQRYVDMKGQLEQEVDTLHSLLQQQVVAQTSSEDQWQVREQELLQRCASLAAEVSALQQRQADDQVLTDIEFEELHAQLQEELQATTRDKSAIAADNAKLLTEVRSLQQTLSLLQNEADSKGSEAREWQERNKQLVNERMAQDKQVTRLQSTVRELEGQLHAGHTDMEDRICQLQGEAELLRSKVQELECSLTASDADRQFVEQECVRLQGEMEALRKTLLQGQVDAAPSAEGACAASAPPRVQPASSSVDMRLGCGMRDHDHEYYLAAALDNLLDATWCFRLV